MGGALNFKGVAVVRGGVFAALLIILTGTDAPRPSIAVVANRENPVTDLSLTELKRIYLGKQTTFSDDAPIRLGVYRDLSEAFYQVVLDMPAHAVKRHWIKMVFSGARAQPPESEESLERVKLFVESNRGAISILPLKDVDNRVKVIALEGMLPDHEEYLLR